MTRIPVPSSHRLFLFGMGLATGMEFYVADSMNLVLVDLTGTLGVSQDQASWVLTVYSAALFLGVPISGWLAAHFGPKRYVIGSVLVFATASLGCALSPTLETLLLFLAVQGFAGSALITWWRATIYLLVPKPKRAASMMHVSVMLYLSSAAGLVLSGALTDWFGWRLLFLPVAVYAAGAVWLLARHYPSPAPEFSADRYRRPDLIGMGLVTVAVISLQVILSRGEIDDWMGSPRIRWLSLVCVGAVAAFLFWQMHGANKRPLLWVGLFRDRRVFSSALIGLSAGMVLSSSLYVLPEYLRGVATQTTSAAQTGRLIAVYALFAALLRPQIGRLIGRIGQRGAVAVAMVMLIASMLLFNRLLTSGTPDLYYLVPLLLYACCLAPLLPSAGSGTVARVEHEEHLLDGVTMYMTFRQLGAATGVGLVTIFLEHRETLHSSRLFAALSLARHTTAQWLATAAATAGAHAGLADPQSREAALALLADVGRQQSQTLAYADAFLFMAAIGVITLMLIPVMPPPPPAKR